MTPFFAALSATEAKERSCEVASSLEPDAIASFTALRADLTRALTARLTIARLADCRALFSADLEFARIIGFSVSLGGCEFSRPIELVKP